MAQVIVDEQSVVVKPWWARVRIVFIGAGLGIVWWVVTTLLRVYILEPLACRDLANAAVCANSFGVAGSIATILVALLGIFVLVKTLQPRPIIIAVSVAVLLWSMGVYVEGLAWYEALLWAIGFYAASYVLFGLIARVVWLPAAIVTAIATVLVARILLAV
jgi:hypothetical protein